MGASTFSSTAHRKARLRCLIDVHGLAERCEVVSETPADKGFGAAALQIRATFKLPPVMGPDGPVPTSRTPDPQRANSHEREAQRRTGAPRPRVIRLGDHVAKVDPHSEGDALVLGGFRIAVSHCPLYLGSAADRIDDAGELCQHSVTGVLHDAATVLGDLRIDQLSQVSLEPLVRPLLIRPHEPRVARHIGG